MVADLRRAAGPAGAALVVGVGNPDRGDDGAGPAVVEELRRIGATGGRPDVAQPPSAVSLPRSGEGLAVLDAGDVPERYLGPMAESGAAVVVFVDAVDFGGRPGQAALLEERDLPGRSCVTHRSSLGLVMRYLRERAGQRSLLLGVQPSSVAFGQGLTPPVQTAVKGVAAAISEALGAAANVKVARTRRHVILNPSTALRVNSAQRSEESPTGDAQTIGDSSPEFTLSRGQYSSASPQNDGPAKGLRMTRRRGSRAQR